ncbi:PREDICTED: gametocyte-specific factor 1-like [Myotis brandtii]|uniref:gametocyte-specific factor 1-like n=1 Tax=Myotis brandtii TaxID=109478 RepID=UPI0007041ACC|nr:PREDICTED: gametocyte-specific factor 1-like [Myotis brandtii]
MEPKALEICSYNLNNGLQASRLQYHLASCRKKNPNVTRKMANGKYNACHVVLIKRLKEHEANCVNRIANGEQPFNLPKVISLHLEPTEKLSNADNQIPDPDIWNIGEQG